MSFANKVVIVTGGSAGIGAAISKLFAIEGANVVIVDRTVEKLDEVAKQCARSGNNHLPIIADVNKDEQTKLIVEKTIKEFGRIDVLVNNAGILGDGHRIIEPNLISVYDKVFTTNVRSLVLLTNLVAPHLVKTKGNIVNIASIAGTRGSPSYALYGASKAAVIQFGCVAALELAEVGVRVNTVSPGPTETDIYAGQGDFIEVVKSNTAQKRLSAPEEVAAVVAFVASEKSKSITGSNYVIDCGSLVKK